MRIAGKVVLVTGASEGIGAACASEFARRGARVAVTARSIERLSSDSSSGRFAIPGDLLNPEDRRRIIGATVEHFGQIDVLLNNAGVLLYAPSWDPPEAETRAMFELNFFAPLDLIRLVAPHMKRRGGGAIVNVASIAAKVPLPWLTLYSASKSALDAFSEGLRMELRGTGIRVTVVHPGYVKTAIQRHPLAGKVPDAVARMKKRFAITAEKCARDIADGVEREARTVMSPWSGWLLVAASRCLPAAVDTRMAAIYPGKERRT